MKSITLHPVTKVNGTVTLPGSKSLSNRILLLAALAKGQTRISNLLNSDDTAHMLSALRQLGVTITQEGEHTVVQGTGGQFTTPTEPLFLGNAGTAYRPLTAVLASVAGEFTLTGEPRMAERPIGHLVEALQALDANIHYEKTAGYPPLHIKGKQLTGGKVSIDGSISSQFLTALLMAAPLFSQQTTIEIKGELVSKPYIAITLAVMKKFGVEVSHNNYRRFVIQGAQQYVSPEHILVEGDASSASYFIAAAALNGGQVTIKGVGKQSVQGDIGFAHVMEQVGAKVQWHDDHLIVQKGAIKAVDIDANAIPDAAMTLATVALFAKGTTAIRNIYNWRVKETDRLYAMATELKKLGAKVEEGKDYLIITPPQQLTHAAIDTYNDHRIAMCFALVAVGGQEVTINDPDCTAKTYPDFFQQLASICHT